MVRIADYGQNPQAASDAPRYRIVPGPGSPASNRVSRRRCWKISRAAGHQIVSVPDDYNQFGCAQLIWKLDGRVFPPPAIRDVTDSRGF